MSKVCCKKKECVHTVVINQMKKMNAKLVSGPFNYEFLISTDGGLGDSSPCQAVG